MSELAEHFYSNKDRQVTKWSHYFEVYERHFARFKGQPVTILEIGVFQGGSLQMWKKYFGPNASIYGIDVNPACSQLEEPGIKIFIGSQTDREFLRSVKKAIPPVDILIDDGGHTMRQQLITFQELYSHVKDNGVYLCEDLHTSYWIEYGGGVGRSGTFIEFAKKLIDSMNAYHSEQSSFSPDQYTKTIDGLHFYDSILVVEKRRREAPKEVSTGIESFDDNAYKVVQKSLPYRLKHSVLYAINSVLRALRLPGFKWR